MPVGSGVPRRSIRIIEPAGQMMNLKPNRIDIALTSVRGLSASVDLFLVSFAILFLELAAIRWIAAYVVTVSFFTNFVLLAAFLGMSVGCLAAARHNRLSYLPALLHVSVFGVLLFYAATSYFFIATVDVQGSGPPEIVYFGTERVGEAALKPGIPLVALLAVLFLILVGWFYPLGQVMGRCFDEIPDRLKAYTLNIGGSLLGIAGFALCSFWSAPPLVWYGIVFLILAYFLARGGELNISNATLLVTTLTMIGLAGWRAPGHQFLWSPYYCIRFSPRTLDVVVNGISHQKMVDRPWELAAYRLPFALYQACFGRAPERVLVIGAGTGNDVAAALHEGAQRVDAVEIDPVIAELGRRYHPNRPYDDPRVRLVIDDGRAFLRRTSQKYDMILYGLVDSLTLQTGMANVRLETYLFTVEAFEEVRNRLKEHGLFAVTNFFREGWVVHRIAGMAREAFGVEPLVLQNPPRRELPDKATAMPGTATVVVSRSGGLEKLFENGHRLCLAASEGGILHSSEACPGPHMFPSILVATSKWQLPTDDWPFLYLRERRIPRHNLLMLMFVVVLGLLLVAVGSPERRVNVDPVFLMLGAGFMLIETKGVVQLARVFGSTWVVNTFVFGGILIAILLANLLVLLVRPRRVWPWYAGLFGALLLTWLVPFSWFAGLAYWQKASLVVVWQFAPIFFAGSVFAILFREAEFPARAFGANIAGAVLGGAAEYAALLVGYQQLVVLAALFYAVAALATARRGYPRSLQPGHPAEF